jgi:hypothetical protein
LGSEKTRTHLADLSAILKNYKELQLIIYAHPREWKFYENSATALQAHYQNQFPDLNFQLNDPSRPSNTNLDEVYLGICFMTTLIFERMQARRKSIIAYFQEKNFPQKKQFDYLKIVENKSELENEIRSAYA